MSSPLIQPLPQSTRVPDHPGPGLVLRAELEARADRATLDAAGYREAPTAGVFDPLANNPDVAVHPTWYLGQAIIDGDVQCTDALLALGAETDLETHTFEPEQFELADEGAGLTALSLAAVVDSDAGALLALPRLVDRGANVHQVDSCGRTLLHFAFHPAVCRYLVDQGVDRYAVDHDGHAPRDVLPAECVTVVERAGLEQAAPAAQIDGRPVIRM